MILITGASGFIGKHLLKKMLFIYGKENILALTSKPIGHCNYLLHNDYDFDKDFFLKLGYSKIQTIIHAGAFTPKSHLTSNDIENCNKNITNTFRLINADLPNLKKIIFLSTLDVYAKAAVITEKTETIPSSLYGFSKLYCEKMIKNWAKEKEITYQTLRIGHVYGPGEEKYQKIIPVVMNNLLKNKLIKIFGEGKDIRTFIYIDDVIDAVSRVISFDKSLEEITIVGSEKTSILNLVNQIVRISGRNPEIEQIESSVKRYDLLFDNSKMIRLLGVPKIKLNDGLKKEWDYMKNKY